ncbi:LytTR family transcriptional regulator DNA-binding domain-containing protein [Pendulispora albinea]|uniref:LytTR family transcriptional regulator DNA-binding domain-containing protein n=1 Tax=Pendulispora albinea TaxID=2741071 RepID=UPI00374E0310
MHTDVVFQASRGAPRTGHESFFAYMRAIHTVLGECACTIDEMVATAERAAVKVTLTAVHRGVFLGVPPTGRKLHWPGSAFFSMDEQRITKIRLLGDIDALKKQLGEELRPFSRPPPPPPAAPLPTSKTGAGGMRRIAIRAAAGRVTFVDVDAIDWIEAAENYVHIHVGPTVHLLHAPIGTLEKALDPAAFIRVHRSAIVRTARIGELRAIRHGEYEIRLTCGARVRSSRTYHEAIKALAWNPF